MRDTKVRELSILNSFHHFHPTELPKRRTKQILLKGKQETKIRNTVPDRDTIS